MPTDPRARLKQWLERGEARLQPLTYPQRELWEASPVPAGEVSNNICAIIQIRGALTPQDSEAALQKVVDRQEAFRLSFLPGKAGPMQFIRKTAKPALQFHTLDAAQQSPAAIEALASAVFTQPFDLLQGPLYRAKVFSKSADDHVLALAIHHSIADGWTLGVFVQDLFAAYLLGVRGSSAALPPVPLSYTEWGAAERAFWQPAALATRAAYWKTHLAGAPRLWSNATTGTLLRQVTHVPADLGRSVRELGRRHEATLFTTLLTAFQITVAKWTGAHDIVVGTPFANRHSQAVRETIGYCCGIVPLRGQVDPTRSFAESLRSVHQTTVECFAHAMPFVELVRAVQEPLLPGRNPVFEIRFALQNHPVPDVAMPGLSLQLRMRSTGTARFDLACEINEEGDALEVAWLYRSGPFTSSDIEAVGSIYLAVLAGVCRSPEILTSTLMSAPK
ncbi:MAG: condensation domain-containing protein [Roseimicrobium sp.]